MSPFPSRPSSIPVLHAPIFEQSLGQVIDIHDVFDRTKQKTAKVSASYVPHAHVHAHTRATPSPEREAERELAKDAVRFLKSRRWPLLFVTASFHVPEDEARDLIRVFKSRVVECQRRGGMRRRYLVEALESQPDFHCHLLVAANAEAKRLLLRLLSSPKFSAFDVPGSTAVDIEMVRGSGEFFVGYGTKEDRSHVPLSGARIRISDDLRSDLLRNGAAVPCQRYRARQPKRRSADIIQLVSHDSRIALELADAA